MKRVCIDCRYINGRPSGIAELVQSLVSYLPDLAPDLHFRLLVSPGAARPLSLARNVEEVVVKAAANGPGTMWWLPNIADLRDVDLFHAPFNIMPASLKMPCIITVHDVMWLTNPEYCERGVSGAFRRAFFAHGIRRALKRADIIATVSEATREAITTIAPHTAGRSFVTLSGVSDTFRAAKTDPAMLSAMGLNPARRFILTVGQFAPYKNHEGAVRSFALASNERTDVDLVLVQRQGRHSEKLLNLAGRLGVGQRVKILRGVSQTELVQLYSSAALLLHPSLAEGFGNPLAEAMACGCPVVTSDISAMPQVTGGAALLANPAHPGAIAAQIMRILDDPTLAAALRQRGMARASMLRWDDFARSNLALYRRILG